MDVFEGPPVYVPNMTVDRKILHHLPPELLVLSQYFQDLFGHQVV